MTISKVHFEFANRVKTVDVLNNPQKYLGRHYKKVLNFWLILDDLSEDQWRVIKERYEAFYDENYSERRKAANLAIDASKKVVGEDYDYNVSWAAYVVTYSSVADWATRELVGNVENPIFLSMFDDL